MIDAPARRVWGIGTSRTIRPHWMLRELDLPYETREILPRTESMQDPDFLAISRRSKVPILEDDGLVIAESGAMVVYLADRYREQVALSPPPASRERARFEELCFFIATELDAPLYIVRRHEGLPSIYGEAPVAVRSAKEYFLRQCEQAEERLSEAGPFLMGEEFSGCDVLLVSCIEWARFAGMEIPGRIAEYRERIADRPAYGQALGHNFPPHAIALLREAG